MEHPSKEVLLRFILGAASRPESRQVVRHLLASCPACAVTLQQLRREPPLDPPPSPVAYVPAFERAAAFVLMLAQPEPVAAEADRRPGTVATAKPARRRWLFG